MDRSFLITERNEFYNRSSDQAFKADYALKEREKRKEG